MTFLVPTFPLVVIARSRRASALVALDRPLTITADFMRVTRRPSEARVFERRVTEALALCQPLTLLHTNGTAWRSTTEVPSLKKAIGVSVRAACDFLGCEPTRNSILARILDAYPEFEPRLLPIAKARFRSDRVRMLQPLLAALIVAHTASLAHLEQHN